MRDQKNKLKKWMVILAGLTLTLFALHYATAQNTGSKINLNSPVSFPVDI